MSNAMSSLPANHTTAGVNLTPPTPLYNSYIPPNTKFSPSMAIIIVVLIFAFFFMGFFAIYVRRCAGSEDTNRERPRTSQAQAKNRGLAKDLVEALPIVHFKDLGEKEDIECPVCLSDFEPEDSLRMLPKCNHVFHLECIDVWFQSHSTCPLCRASLLPDVCDGKCEGDGAAEQENGVMEVPQEVVVSIDVAAEVPVATGLVRTPSELPTEEATAAPGPVISRGDERNSARDALRRNSLSFKRAVRGVAALEMAASPLRVEKRRSFNKLPNPTNFAIRRSNSLGTDIKSVRSYFINSEGTLHGMNFYVGTASKQGIISAGSFSAVSKAPLVKPQDHWITIDLEGGTSSAKPPVSRSPLPSGTARVWPERWSFNSLRGVLPLSRSASDLVQRDQHLPV